MTEFDREFEASRAQLTGLALRLTCNQHAAEDLLQDTWLKARRGYAGYTGEAKFSSWACRIMQNCWRDQLRLRRSREISLTADGEFDLAELIGLNDTYFGGSDPVDVKRLRKAIARLSEDHRQAIMLRYFRGLEDADSAKLCGLPLGSFKSRLFRARERLRQMLEGVVTA